MVSDQPSQVRYRKIAVTEMLSVRGAVLAEAAISLATPPCEDLLTELHPSERDFAQSRPGRRQVEFVAGRRALRAALRHLGWRGDQALLSSSQGRPVLPSGFTGSITHKDGLAFAVAAATDCHRTLGIDCEVIGDRDRSSIARKILRPAEMSRWESGGRQWPALLEFFSTKEAIYKALHPHVPRYIGFEEAEVDQDGAIHLYLSGNEGPFQLRRHLDWRGQRLLVVVEVEPSS